MNNDNMGSSYPQPQPEQQPTNTPKKNNTWIYLALIALLLGTNVYLFMNKTQLTKDKEKTELSLAESDSTRAIIQQDYDAALARLDELITQNKSLDSLVSDKDGEIEKLKKDINRIMSKSNATAADLAKAQSMITQLNSKINAYEKRIAQLEGDNKTLTERNVSLTQERDSANQQSAELRKLGSVLYVNNIRLSSIDLRKGGKKEVETGKAKKVDIIRIVFDIIENRIAEAGSKEIFIKIINPEGKLLSNAAYGSGVTTLYNGDALSYTVSKQVQLQENTPVKNISAEWQQESTFIKGEYKVEFYNLGHLIGESVVTLK